MHPLTIVVVSRLAKIASKHFTSSDTFPSLVLPGDCCFWKQRREEYKKKTLALISKRKEEEESEKQERKNKESEKRKKQQKKKKKKKKKKKEIQPKVLSLFNTNSPVFFFCPISFSPSLYSVAIMASGLASDEVAEDYKNSLEDLTTNDRFQISNLTVIAKENTEHAMAISRVLENHIRTVGAHCFLL